MSTRDRIAWTLLRLAVATLLSIHGWARLLNDAVMPFGAWLDEQGLPLGVPVAIAITALEIVGPPILALGRLVFPLALLHGTLLLVGIVLVHAPAGWFVVGLGRNGAEYSVLLVVALATLAIRSAPRRREPVAVEALESGSTEGVAPTRMEERDPGES